MKIDSELTEKSAKNTQRWWKLTATIVVYRYIGPTKYSSVAWHTINWTARRLIGSIVYIVAYNHANVWQASRRLQLAFVVNYSRSYDWLALEAVCPGL